MDEPPSLVVARVIVLLQPAERHGPLIDLGARLAETFGAELAGWFVENSELLDMAALPFTRLVPFRPGGIASLGRDMMAEALRAEAQAAERSLRALAARRRLAFSYRVMTVPAGTALVEICGEPGLAVAAFGGALGSEDWLARIDLLAERGGADNALLLVRGGRPVTGPVTSLATQAALAYGMRLAALFGGGLTVLAADAAEAALAGDRLAPGAGAIETAADLAAAVGRRRGGILVVDRARIGPLVEAARAAGAHLLLVG